MSLVFSIEIISEQYIRRTYIVRHQVVDKRTEKFVVQRMDEIWILESNRPLFRSKGLKKRRPDFKFIDGDVRNVTFLAKMEEAIYGYVLKAETHAAI
jgi:hypothetical protein